MAHTFIAKSQCITAVQLEKDTYMGHSLAKAGDYLITRIGTGPQSVIEYLVRKELFELLFDRTYTSLQDFIDCNKDKPEFQIDIPEVPGG